MDAPGPAAPNNDPAPQTSIWGTIRRYPIPFVALAGLGVGAALTYLGRVPSAGQAAWLITLIAGGAPLVYQTGRRILRGEFASDVIAALAILGAIALDQAFAGVLIVLMQSGGEAIDSYAFHRASASLHALLERAPRRALRRVGDLVEVVAAEAVEVGDRLVVPTGDMLPVDGTVSSVESLLDESAVSGEPLPRRRLAGEHVLSGSLNVGPPFELRADRRSAESQYGRIVALVRDAQTRKPPLQRLADRYAVWFTPLALVVAALGWGLTRMPQTALAVLVVATPCPLIIATPIAVIGAVNRAAARGIVVKNGGALEEIAQTQVVVFDKTGTITSGRPEVEQVFSFDTAYPPDRILGLAASLEQFSSHPLAAATVRQARSRSVVLPPATGSEETAGAGVSGQVDGLPVRVGSSTFVTRGLRPDPEVARTMTNGPASRPGALVAYVLVDRNVVGAIRFADRLRPEVPGLVRRLREQGARRIVLLTGDTTENALAAAHAAGISEAFGNLLPEEKEAHVRECRERDGTTVMVGDGINDAAALASASVGVAMGARGSGISAEAADMVLLVDDVGRLGDGIDIGQRMVRIAKQGIVFGLGASLVLMAIASFGFVVPALGAVLQEVIDVLVIANALRVL
jgi:heavy metal translocating P-type ATPase